MGCQNKRFQQSTKFSQSFENLPATSISKNQAKLYWDLTWTNPLNIDANNMLNK
jgi:hypothetical protein